MNTSSRRITPREALTALALLLAVLCVWFWPMFTGDQLGQSHVLWTEHPFAAQAPTDLPPINSGEGDDARQYHVFMSLARRSLDEGRLPLWNPYSYAGMTFAGNMQSALGYPLTWVGLLLGPATAAGVIALLKLLTAGFGAYLLSRQLRIGHGGGLLAGLVFMLCGPLVVWLQWPLATVFSLLPWLLLVTDRLRERCSRRAFAAVAAVVALQILAGHPESAFLSSCAAGVYLGVRLALERGHPWRSRLRLVAGWLGAHLVGVLATAVVTVPFLAAYGDSITREAHGTFSEEQLPMSSLLGYLLPNVYGDGQPDYVGPLNYYLLVAAYVGVPALLLTGVALVRLRRSHATAALAVMGALGAAAGFGVPPVSLIVEHVPPFSGGSFQRCLFIPALALAIGAGAGLETVLRQSLSLRRAVLAACVPLGIVAVWGLVDRAVDLWPASGQVERAAVLHFGTRPGGRDRVHAGARKAPRSTAVAAVLLVAVLDLAFLQGFNRFLPPEKAHPGAPGSLAFWPARSVTTGSAPAAHSVRPMSSAPTHRRCSASSRYRDTTSRSPSGGQTSPGSCSGRRDTPARSSSATPPSEGRG